MHERDEFCVDLFGGHTCDKRSECFDELQVKTPLDLRACHLVK